jgi:predicted Rossmann fold nucleotide-binding protein DprA/Smf involved in DNA uptake
MDKESALHAIMLSELPRVGDRAAERIVALNHHRGHGLGTFFRLPDAVLRDDYKLHAQTIARVCGEGAAHERRCQWLVDQIAGAGGLVLSLEDADYPERLRRRLQPPATVLFGFGNPALLGQPTLAVLNSRTLSEHAVTASLLTVQAAAAQGYTLVGGGMKATYRITAVAGRAAAAPRIIVLDRGIFAAFGACLDRDPFGFGPGRGPLDVERNLVLSPFRLMDHAAAHNGKRRDATVASLADVIVAAHARPGGEIEHVCLGALDRGQAVLSWYGENAGLVAAGATPIQEGDLANLRRFAPSSV